MKPCIIKTLFIVNTPFQCLLMFEALRYYHIDSFEVLLKLDYIEKNNEMVIKLLEDNGIAFKTIKFTHLYDLYRYVFKKKNRYDLLFNGDYYGGGLTAYFYCLINAKRKAKIYYFDDGLQTLHVFANPPRKRLRNWQERFMAFQFGSLKLIKGIGKPHYFTIFNVVSDKFIVERNTLEGLKSKLLSTTPKGLFIIGTNTTAFLDKRDYPVLLRKMFVDLKSRYPFEDIWYCPHRRNLEDEELMNLLRENSIRVYDTKVTVEYDFINNGINPIYVAGFGSTALYTLKLIYNDAIIENVRIIRDVSKTVITAEKEKQYGELGVKTVDYYNN